MPRLGEIKKARELGRKGYYRYIYVDCPHCPGKRWVVLLPRGPMSVACKACGSKEYDGTGEANGNWKGGRITVRGGYISVLVLGGDFFFPMANKRYVLEHRLVVAKHLHRCLLPWETVHHKNGIKNDNRLENLELLPNRSKHNTFVQLHLQKQAKQIKELQARVTLLEADNTLLRLSVSATGEPV